MSKKFHLGWFTNFTVDEWNDPFAAGGGMPWNGRYYVEMAQALERACFDYLMLEDTLMLSDAYGHSTEMYMKKAIMVPKHDPAPLAALIAGATTRLGIVSTLSTMAYPPFLLARLCATSTTSPRVASAGTSSPAAKTPRRRTSAWTSCRRANCATRWRTNTWTW
jgi:hypothetical protein